jgi:hypothetical protein
MPELKFRPTYLKFGPTYLKFGPTYMPELKFGPTYLEFGTRSPRSPPNSEVEGPKSEATVSGVP